MRNDRDEEISRSVKWASFGVMAFVSGAISLIVTDPDPTWMFSPYAFIIGIPCLALDLMAYPEHTGLKVYTYKYWTGRPFTFLFRTLTAICLCVLLAISVTFLSVHYSAEANRKRIRDQGMVTNARIVQLFSNNAKNRSFYIKFNYEVPERGTIERTIKVPSKRYYNLKHNDVVRVGFFPNQPDQAIPVDIETAEGIPIELAWMFFLPLIFSPGWYLIKPYLLRMRPH